MEQAKICKHNMRCYPIYRMLSYDFLFFYTINILFLTQVKNISPSGVLIIDAFYSIFGILVQFPASYILDKVGRKKSLVIGTLFNAIYLLVVIFSKNLTQLILAEIASAMGFALKDIASPSLLNESIPITKRKSEIFGKLSGKAMSGYYILNAISLIISGFLYEINGYMPMILSLAIVIITFILANSFYEPLVLEDEEKEKENEALGIKDSFKFIFSSGRLKSLLLYSSIMLSLIYILASSEIYLIEELELSSSYIGIIFAILGIISGIAAQKQDKFQKIFKNKTLTILGLIISLSCITSCIGFLLKLPIIPTLIIILISYGFKYAVVGIYNVLITKYFSNFTNEEIDAKIYAAQLLFNSILSATFGLVASAILARLDIVNSTLIFGTFFLVLFIIVTIYMKNKLGLKPEEYNKEEVKYSKIKEII